MGLVVQAVRVDPNHTEYVYGDNQMTNKTIWRLPVVMARTGLPRSTIYHKISKGEFPENINLGPRSVGWVADEVERFIQDRIDASRSNAQAT